MKAKAAFGGGAVEKHMSDVTVPRKKTREVIGDDRIRFDCGIKAARAYTACKYIPQCDAGFAQTVRTGVVRHVGSGVDQITHDAPERIARMGVVLSGA